MNRLVFRSGYLAAGVLLTAVVGAQPVPSEFVVSGEAAAHIRDSTTINLATAERITQTCERLATERGVAISVYVVDKDGNFVYMHRMDGQIWTNIATAEMKALTALRLRAPSKQMMNHVIRNPSDEWQQMELGYFANAGGLPIIVNDQLIGAIGIGGSAPRLAEGWSDEICAHNAMTEVLGPQPPLLEDLPRPRPPATAQAPRFRPASPPSSSLPEDWVVSGPAAARILDGNQISSDAARRVAGSCRAWAGERGNSMALTIVDVTGDAVHGERLDGTLPGDVKTSLLKAETARRSRGPTSARQASVTNNPAGLPRSVILFEYLDVEGGLPIVVDGQMIGAIGVSGLPDGQNEDCAVTGITAVFGDRATVPVYPQG